MLKNQNTISGRLSSAEMARSGVQRRKILSCGLILTLIVEAHTAYGVGSKLDYEGKYTGERHAPLIGISSFQIMQIQS